MPDKDREARLKEAARKEAVIQDLKAKKAASADHWDPIYKRCQKHKDFTLAGKQMERQEWAKFGLTDPFMPNLLLTYLNHHVNQILQVEYLGKVTPNGFGATESQAEARQAVLRGQQQMNMASQIFNFAARDQCASGISYTLTFADYAHSRGFEKTIKDEYLQNTFDVYPSPYVQTSTFSDSDYWIIKKSIPKSEWKKETGEDPNDWGTKTKKTLYFFWVKEEAEDKEYLLEGGFGSRMSSESEKRKRKGPTGKTIEEDDLTGVEMDEMGNPVFRPTKSHAWKWYKIDEDDNILDEDDYEGTESPVTACTGRKVVDSKGNVEYQPMTKFAEAPQKMFTIITNIIALRLGRSPYSRWKIPFESIDLDQLKQLRKASVAGDLDILYKALTSDGKAIPPPEEIEPYILDPLLIQLQSHQEMIIQKIFGIFDPSLGEKSNERSGVAIRERKESSDISNFDYKFNLLEYIKQVTKCRLDLIPKYLTAPQQVAFVDKEDRTTIEWINTQGGVQFNPNEEYSLSIEAQPIADTARKEEAEFLAQMAESSELVRGNPQAMALVIGAQPGRAAKSLSDILKNGDPQLQQAQAEIGQLQQQLQQTTDAAKAKIMQDKIKEESLQAIVKMLRQQIQLIRAAGQAKDAQAGIQDLVNPMESQIKLLELQVDNKEADTNRIQAANETARIKKEMVELAFPTQMVESAFPTPEPSKMYPIKP